MPERMPLPVGGFAVAIATVGGVGDLRPAPGTWASVAAGALALALLLTVPAAALTPVLGAVTLLATLAGLATAGAAARRLGRGDPAQVVIDEVAGVLLAVACVPAAALTREPVLAVVLAVALFRVFDIAKPWPVASCERLPGALGIMADDLVAGLLAGLLVASLLS
jgi:phosphatidylglycerophosphatase A